MIALHVFSYEFAISSISLNVVYVLVLASRGLSAETKPSSSAAPINTAAVSPGRYQTALRGNITSIFFPLLDLIYSKQNKPRVLDKYYDISLFTLSVISELF